MSEERTAGTQGENLEQGGYEAAEWEGSVGYQLRLAREARGVSVEEASVALKLSPRQVEALEANDWSHLPKTIIRGFVRNYARYLELDPAEFMAALDGMSLPKGPELALQVGAPVSMPREGRADRRDYARVIAGLIVLLLAVLAFFIPAEMWRSSLDAIKQLIPMQAQKPAPEPAHEPPARGPEKDSGTSVVVPELAPVPDTVVPAPVVPPPAEQSSAADTPAMSGEALVFSFAQPSWVEVRDRSGQVVFSQLSQAGSRREVSGQPPFSLVVGNATHVTLHYKGKPVDLSKRSKDDVARLTLE